VKILTLLNRAIVVLSSIALVLASCVLTYSVVLRYFTSIPTDWTDEFSVFLLIGVSFMSAAWVHSQRGHVAIEALAAILPPRVNVVRVFIVDMLSGLFCAFFAWKSWTLFDEAYVEGYSSATAWAPPLWIPYSLMSVGMTLLTIQIFAQAFQRQPAVPQPLPPHGGH
jgi:TRAP-type C4-dicarboxylate transport system permease small subunit